MGTKKREEEEGEENESRFLSFFSFWFFKILILIGIGIGAFFIPSENFGLGNSSFEAICTYTLGYCFFLSLLALMIIGSICGFLFILIQLILLIDFAHRYVFCIE
jgi:Serine incorporator (Serinc)